MTLNIKIRWQHRRHTYWAVPKYNNRQQKLRNQDQSALRPKDSRRTVRSAQTLFVVLRLGQNLKMDKYYGGIPNQDQLRPWVLRTMLHGLCSKQINDGQILSQVLVQIIRAKLFKRLISSKVQAPVLVSQHCRSPKATFQIQISLN